MPSSTPHTLGQSHPSFPATTLTLTYLHDPNGNLTSDGSRTYVYDIENRLVSSSDGAALAYDPLGRLFEVSGPATGTTRFLYDGDALVAEYNGAHLIAARHVHWLGANLPMVTYQGEGLATIRQLLADGSRFGVLRTGRPSAPTRA